MKSIYGWSVAAVLALTAGSGLSPLQAQASSPSGGDYTAAQATVGAALYKADCSACHGASMRGPLGPALIGDAFTAQWTGEPVADMYVIMSRNMPQNAPGSLKPAEYLAITAYILQQNRYPAGSVPLTEAKLKSIRLVAPPM